MTSYLIRRLLLSVLTAFLVSIIIFSSVRLLPGDIVLQLIEGSGYDPKAEDQLRDQLGLNRPALVQYGVWIGDVVQGDLGESLWTGEKVTSMIQDRVPVTLELAILTISVGAFIGILVGTLAAIFQDRWPDYLLRSASLLFISVPFFWTATLTVALPANWWAWTPPIGYVDFWDDPQQNLSVYWVPVLILGAWLAGSVSRMQRSAMLEVLRLDYVRTARAKGLRPVTVIQRHVLRNAFIPVLTILGIQAVFLLGGSVIAENIYSLPGMGSLMLSSLNVRDYPVVQGIALVFTFILLVMNLFIDLSYAVIDPRIRIQ